ncbi:MAG: class I SAM-dependent methyltransferase [Phycisphaerales bacterium]
MATTPPVHEAAHRRDWPEYFNRMEGKPPRDTLLKALDLFGPINPENPPLAVDLGCGAGRDSVEMLNSGWRVWAQDSNDDAIARCNAHPEIQTALSDRRMSLVQTDFESLADSGSIPQAQLVNASFSLPFCPPSHFDDLWNAIDSAIAPGSRFSGQFFGDRDDWATIEDRTHLPRVKMLDLFDQYIIESLFEEDRPSSHTGGGHKHWHVFHIIARKRGTSV